MDSGSRVWGSGFRVLDLGSRVHGLRLGYAFEMQGSGFRVHGIVIQVICLKGSILRFRDWGEG